jgi:ubiquinone biosynthesis accessory factor UbiJ
VPDLLSGPAAAAINHLLRDAGWARERLLPFAAHSVRFELASLSASFTIAADGRLLPAASDVEPAAVVRLTAPALFRLARRDESARQEIEVGGDAALASALVGVLANLRWDVEEDLSRVVGDIAARRLTRSAAALLAWQAKAASNLAQSLAEYWTEEQPLIASRDAVRGFIEAVDALRDDVERLDKRIERLSRAASRRDEA